jgi:hypothetical protein
LPSWVNSNLAPVETNPSKPSENVQPSSAVEAQSNQQQSNRQAEASVQPNPFNAGQNPGLAQTQTSGVWEISSSLALRSIAFRNQGISHPEVSTFQPATTREPQVILAHPIAHKSVATKTEQHLLAK